MITPVMLVDSYHGHVPKAARLGTRTPQVARKLRARGQAIVVWHNEELMVNHGDVRRLMAFVRPLKTTSIATTQLLRLADSLHMD